MKKWFREGSDRTSMLAAARKELIDTKGNWSEKTKVNVQQLFIDMLLENEQIGRGIRQGMVTVENEIARLQGKIPELYELGFTLDDLVQGAEQMIAEDEKGTNARSLIVTADRSSATSAPVTQDRNSSSAPTS